MRVVELKSAYHWHCDYCGHANFALPQKAELTDADAEEAYRKFHDLDEWSELPEGWRDFELVHLPDTVMCEECQTSYVTVDERSA